MGDSVIMGLNLQKRTLTIGLVVALAGSALAGCLQGGDGDGGAGGAGDRDLALKLGTMMPLTGALNNLGPDMQSGAKLAIEEVNAADVGLTIEAFHEDDKTTDTSAAPSTFDRLVNRGVTAVAGPCCSGVTSSILDLAVQNQVVVSSPSATSPALTERDNKGFFWRVPPSDAVQGKVLANLVGGDGVKTVNMIIVNNAYGNGLASVFQNTFTTSLQGVVTKVEKYSEGATTFNSEVSSVCQGAGTAIQGIVLVAYIDDGAAILKEMQARGCLGQVKVFGSEGIYDAALPQKAGKDADGNWIAAGVRGTNPETADLGAYNAKFKTRYGKDPSLYSAESYDAVMYVALAALAAKSTKGPDIAANLAKIANPPGEKVSDFKKAAGLIAEGKDIDWVGQAHDFDYDAAKHEPVTGVYSYWEVQDDGTIKIVETGKSA